MTSKADAIREHLISTQPGIERWLAEHDAIEPLEPSGVPPIIALPRIVVRQMLSGKASQTIIDRAEKLASEQGLPYFAALSEVDLLGCGLSRAKAATVKRFADAYESCPQAIEAWQGMSASELLVTIKKHKGIGEWTASILAMFHLGHEDIFPLGDNTLRKTIMRMADQGVVIIPERATPYRTYLAAYLWQFADQNRI